MKARISFVSNSSTSSYLLVLDPEKKANGLSADDLLELLDRKSSVWTDDSTKVVLTTKAALADWMADRELETEGSVFEGRELEDGGFAIVQLEYSDSLSERLVSAFREEGVVKEFISVFN